jgi:alpha-L-fucosidase 2
LLFAEKNKEAQVLANVTFPRQAPKDLNYGMPYKTVGSLWIEFSGHKKYSDYKRELDIEKTVSSMRYSVNGVTYTREVLASFSDDVIIIMKLTANTKKSISYSLSAISPQLLHNFRTQENKLFFEGTSGSADNKTGKIKFVGEVLCTLKGGTLTSTLIS